MAADVGQNLADLENTMKNRTLLAEYDYERAEVVKGYSGQTLYINLTDNTIEARPVTEQMKEIFIGGRGFGLWLLWNGIARRTRSSSRRVRWAGPPPFPARASPSA
jgi:aldehyde:ferredoxin oxidoreductase